MASLCKPLRAPTPFRHRRRTLGEKGAGLIEVLVALAIAAIGILGASALLINANRATNSAHYRTVATGIATELADRMRANIPALEADADGGQYVTANAPDCDSPPMANCAMSPAAAADAVTDCTPAQMAAHDLWQMGCVNGARTLLPNGDFSISCLEHGIGGIPVACAARVITVTWQGPLNDQPDEVTLTFLPSLDEATGAP